MCRIVDRCVVTAAGRGDAVLSARQLVLQSDEELVGFQLRVASITTSRRAIADAPVAGRHLLCVVVAPAHLVRASATAWKDVLPAARTLRCFHEIRNQVMATLRWFSSHSAFDRLLLRREFVRTSSRRRRPQETDSRNCQNAIHHAHTLDCVTTARRATAALIPPPNPRNRRPRRCRTPPPKPAAPKPPPNDERRPSLPIHLAADRDCGRRRAGSC